MGDPFMFGHCLRAARHLACALALAAPAVQAAEPPPPPATVPGWNAFVDGLRTLPERLLAKLPEAQRNDPQVQQEVARVALESLVANALEAIGGDGDHPAFIANQNLVLNFPQPNSDTIYRVSRVTPGGTYRLRGERGTLRLANIGQVGPLPGEPGAASARPGPNRSYLDLNKLRVDAKGRYDVILSPARPAGYTGDWWALQPGTTKLLLRMVSADWSKERDPAISIERLDLPPRKLRPSPADLEQRLQVLPKVMAFLPLMFIDHGERLRAEGFVNRLKWLDLSRAGGLTGQYYYEGAFDLGEDEALLVEVRAPTDCAYRSMLLGNDYHETLDWQNNQSSLNDAQAKPDKDGILRIVISGKDPGVPNWLDTAGHRRGLIQGRWTDCATTPSLPTARVIPIAGLRKLLPPGTPVVTAAQREAIIRERRAAYQQRPLW